jgi:hypothetical protein
MQIKRRPRRLICLSGDFLAGSVAFNAFGFFLKGKRKESKR